MLDMIFYSLAATLVQAEKLSVNPGKRTGIQYAGEGRGHGSRVVGGVVLQCGIRWTTCVCVTACMCFFCRRKRLVLSQCSILDKVQSVMARVVTWGARRNDRPTQIRRARACDRSRQECVNEQQPRRAEQLLDAAVQAINIANLTHLTYTPRPLYTINTHHHNPSFFFHHKESILI